MGRFTAKVNGLFMHQKPLVKVVIKEMEILKPLNTAK
jgi:hypothetical protein